MRKLVVGELEFLQAQHIDGVGGQPFQHLRQTDGEGVDVPGGYAHNNIFLLINDVWKRLVAREFLATIPATGPSHHRNSC